MYVELYCSSTRGDCNMICWLQFDQKPDTYSPKSLYGNHGVRIYDNSKQEECSHLMPASLVYSKSVIFKDYSTLGVHYWDLQARVHEQETRNLTLHEAQPSAVLNFEFLVRERVLVNPDNALQECI